MENNIIINNDESTTTFRYNQLYLHVNNEIPYSRIKPTILCTDAIKINKANMLLYKSTPQKIVYHDKTIKNDNSLPKTISYEQLSSLLNSDELISINKDNKTYKDINSKVQFDSDFESGNLRMAIELNELSEFDLIIRPETESDKTYQWFFFSLICTEPSLDNTNIIKLNVINMVKDKMIFSSIIPVLIYNSQEEKWSRNTFNVYYYSNGINCPKLKNINLCYSTLSFSFTFVPNVKYYFAYGYPYTYTQLKLYLSTLNHNHNIRFGSIGKTHNNIDIPLIVMTDFSSSKEEIGKRQCVLLTSRIHSGETSSSYVIQGVIEFLSDTSPENNVVQELLKKYIFKIVPMINVDGVILGNYRTNSKFKDLNRTWINPEQSNSICVFHLKNLINKTLINRPIFFYCDFHGHSNKSNFFLYGCQKENAPNYENVFMNVIHQINPHFDLSNCVNKIHANKTKTGRAILKNEFKVDLSYCLETSMTSIFHKEKKNKYIPFTIKEYKKIGHDFCLALHEISNEEKFNQTIESLNK